MTIALAVPACSTKSSPLITSEPRDASPAAELASAAPPDASNPSVADAAPSVMIADAYAGEIDPSLGVVMRLHREGDALTGSYFYEGPGVELDIKGTLADDGSLSLTETESGGKVTGAWNGRVAQSGNLVGVWSDPKEEKMRAFQLTPIPRKKGGPAVVVRRTVRYKMSPKKRPLKGAAALFCSGEIRYPEVLGLASPSIEAALNERLRKAQPLAFVPTSCDTALVATGAFEVHLNRSGILSLSVFHAEVSAADPSPASGAAAINVLIDTGEEILLPHLLKLHGMDAVLGLLEPIIERRIKATPGASEGDMEVVKDAVRKGDFLLEEKGIRFIAYGHLPAAKQALDADRGMVLGYDVLADALNPASKAVRAWKP